jgi:hypothetical protein
MESKNLYLPLIAGEVMGITQDLCNIAGYGIHSGIHPGPKANEAAQYILEKLHAAGLTEARLEQVKVNDPFPDQFEVTVEVENNERRLISGFPLLWTVGTLPEGITGELAYLGCGYKSDFERVDVKGKIALIDHRHYRHTSTASGPAFGWAGAVNTAQRKGAIAVFLAELQVDGPKMKWQPGTPQNLFPIPGFSVGKSEGAYLREVALSGKPHKVHYTLSVQHEVVDCFNVVAELPGNGSSDEVILAGTHYDTVFTGAVDNNASVALMIKWAEYFASKNRESRNRDMIFAWCMGHDSFDNNSGHYQFAEQHRDRLTKAIVWDVDHAAGGTKYVEVEGELKPTDETSELYTSTNNYTFSRLASFYLDKYGFVNTIDQFSYLDKDGFVNTIDPFKLRGGGPGPGWGIAPTNNPWVVAASITRFYHSSLDTPEKITLDQLERAYAAHVEILEAVDRTPEGFLRYDTIDKTRANTPPKVRITVLSDTVRVGDTIWVANDDTFFRDDRTCYRYPGIPEWACLKWDWGDGSITFGSGVPATHVYKDTGSYKITMTFTDTEGGQSVDTKYVTVLPELGRERPDS